MSTAAIIKLALAFSEASAFAVRAAQAAENGDEEAAREYLKQARNTYESARDKWGNA